MQENKGTVEMDFCEIIQMKCPYSYGCSVYRLHSGYEKAKEKSVEIIKNSGKRLSNAGWI